MANVTRTVIDGRDHLSTAQVARFLRVKPATVYAYVSRGVLTPTRIPGRRGSWFPLSQVRGVAGPPRGRRRPPGLAEQITTSITSVESDRLVYRGRDAVELAEHATFAEVCAWLWQTGEVTFPVDTDDLAAARRSVAALPEHADTADVLRSVALTAGARDVWRHDLSRRQVARCGARLIALCAAVSAQTDVQTDAHTADPVALLATRATELPDGGQRWIEQACILLADHELAGSTTAARVTASVRADPYAVVVAALSAWDSPLHGRVSLGAYRTIAAAMSDPAGTAAALAAAEKPPPGFGHLVYVGSDPRFDALVASLRQVAPGHRSLRAADLVVEAVSRRHDVVANVDLALAVGAHVLGATEDFGEVLFAHARIAGWIAHAMEEYEAPPMRFRLRGVYTGERPPDRG